MRKSWIMFLSVLILFLLSSCKQSDLATESQEFEESFAETLTVETKEYKVIAEGEYYRIRTDEAPFIQYYDVFNKRGEVVYSSSEERPLSIQMINDSILEIEIGFGTGLQQRRYYDAEEDLFSEEYIYVIACRDRLLAYIKIPESGSAFENRKIVVLDMFDPETFYQEFSLDFSKVDTPVVDAAFSEDKTSLAVVYLAGENGTETTVELDLMQDTEW